jgi:hypothetical protein
MRPVPSLRDTQRAFSAALLGGSVQALDALVREAGIAAAQRVAIYANNSRIGFEQALAATYPVIQRLGGTDWFRQHARSYQLRCPSRCGDLQYVGERYADYLQAELAGTRYEYFADVARLEWACQEALVAGNDSILDPQLLASVAAEDYGRIVLALRASVRLLESRFPLLAIWKANQTESAGDAATISLSDGPDRLVIIRREHHVELRVLTPDTFAVLQLLTSGVTLGEVAAAAAKSSRHCNFGATLRELFSMQVFANYKLDAACSPRPCPIDTASRSRS